MSISVDYRAFLAAEGVPPVLQQGRPLEYWDALLEGVVQLGGSYGTTSWERFHRSIPGLHNYPPSSKWR